MANDEQVIVVAHEGYSVILNIGGDCLTIDAFTPVNLSEMYDDSLLRNCGSLQAHLREGNLVKYVGQQLPKNPNKQKIDTLRQSTAQHIRAQYSQSARDTSHPTMQVETSAVNVNADSEKSLQDQVAESRRRVEVRAVKNRREASQRDATNADTDAPTPSLDPEKPSVTDAKKLGNLKVSMDVPVEDFVAKQQESRRRLEKHKRAAEERATKETNQLASDQDNNTSGGQ